MTQPPERDFLADADAEIKKHWRGVDQPWKPSCESCVSEAEGCPKLTAAESLIDGLHWLSGRGKPASATSPAKPLPEIPKDTHLSLAPGEWYVEAGIPAAHRIDLRVVGVQRVTADVASVDGHGLDCKWADVACQEPWCLQVLVSVPALCEAAARL